MGSTRRTAVLRPILLALSIAAAAGALHAAAAQASATGYSEPAYTKTSTNNSYHWHWVAQTGLDENNVTRYEYYLCFGTYVNNVQQETSDGTAGPGSSGCTGSLRAG